MKTITDEREWEHEPPAVVLKQLRVRVVHEDELERASRLLEEEHYLGDHPGGRRLLQVVEYEGQWVALLDWGNAAHKLADREEWIGWTAQQRTERLPLVVMNRRFLVLGRTRMPNLASRALALGCRALPEHWQERYGYRPVLAETFSDIELFEGTCYKASGWIGCGQTKGFGRHRVDYYRHHGRPKKLWLKALNRNARTILTAMDVPAVYRRGLNLQSPERDLPLQLKQVTSLREHLREHLDDPRAANRSFPFSSLLALVVMALFAGRHSLAAIHRYGQFMNAAQRRALDWPMKREGTGRKAPSYSALRNTLIQIDPDQLAATISQWLQGHLGELPRALAVDGKWVRDRVLTVCLTDHETAAPVAVGIAGRHIVSQEQKREGEQTVARKLYATTSLQGAIVTADALHNSRPDAEAILAAGGDYLIQLKQEVRHSYRQAQAIAAGSPLLPSKSKPRRGMAGSRPGK